MGIRQLPSGACQVRFQRHGVSHAATYPTREMAEDTEPLLRAVVLAGPDVETEADGDSVGATRSRGPVPGPPRAPSPAQVRSSSAAAAQLIDTILAGGPHEATDPATPPDELLTTGQAAVLLGVSRLVAMNEGALEPSGSPISVSGVRVLDEFTSTQAAADQLGDTTGAVVAPVLYLVTAGGPR